MQHELFQRFDLLSCVIGHLSWADYADLRAQAPVSKHFHVALCNEAVKRRHVAKTQTHDPEDAIRPLLRREDDVRQQIHILKRQRSSCSLKEVDQVFQSLVFTFKLKGRLCAWYDCSVLAVLNLVTGQKSETPCDSVEGIQLSSTHLFMIQKPARLYSIATAVFGENKRTSRDEFTFFSLTLYEKRMGDWTTICATSAHGSALAVLYKTRPSSSSKFAGFHVDIHDVVSKTYQSLDASAVLANLPQYGVAPASIDFSSIYGGIVLRQTNGWLEVLIVVKFCDSQHHYISCLGLSLDGQLLYRWFEHMTREHLKEAGPLFYPTRRSEILIEPAGHHDHYVLRIPDVGYLCQCLVSISAAEYRLIINIPASHMAWKGLLHTRHKEADMRSRVLGLDERDKISRECAALSAWTQDSTQRQEWIWMNDAIMIVLGIEDTGGGTSPILVGRFDEGVDLK